jgi:di/tricarboxylate transporter
MNVSSSLQSAFPAAIQEICFSADDDHHDYLDDHVERGRNGHGHCAITPLITSLGRKSGVTKALLLGVPLAAIVGGMGTIIGTPANAIAVGELDNKGIAVSFLDWMIFSIPVAVTLTVGSYFLLRILYLKQSAAIDSELLQANLWR